MSPEEFKKYIKDINVLLEQTDQINRSYNEVSLVCKNDSLEFFKDNLLQPLKLCDSTTLFLIMGFVDNHTASGKKQVGKMHLIATYQQGFDVSTELIMEGNYIKAAATIKQDFEIIVRLNEINQSKDKHGKTPNAQNGPRTYKEMNGYLNDIAHISKEDILNFILKHENGDTAGISHIKRFNKTIAHRLMTYNIAIKVEMLRLVVNFYLELVGEDETHKRGLIYYQIALDRFREVGMME